MSLMSFKVPKPKRKAPDLVLPVFSWEDLREIKLIGKGSFGSVESALKHDKLQWLRQL